MNTNRGDTNHGHRPEDESIRRQIVRMKVVRGTTRPDPDFPADPDKAAATPVHVCHIWDGWNEGVDEIPVVLQEPALPGAEIYATRPDGGTDETNPETATTPGDATTEKKVIWREVFRPLTRYFIEIVGYAPIVDVTNRWAYSWERRRVVRHGSWTAPDTPESSVTTGILAYNSVEANNSDSGWQGNSANLDDLPAGINLIPIQGNPVVEGKVEINCDGDPEMIFSLSNSLTNLCPPPPV